MSSTYLYAGNDTIYDMSVSSTGTVLSYTDITTRVPLPSIQANANKYLKVKNDGQNLEWGEVEIGGGLELILDERTASNPPSICFEDTSGTKYNTGINMYRDTTNANEETISFYSDNSLKMSIAETSTSVSNIFKINGGTQFNSQTLTNADTPFTIVQTTPSLLLLDASDGTVAIRLQDMAIGQKVCCLKTNTTGSFINLIYLGSGITVYTPVGNIATGSTAIGIIGTVFRGYFEILRLNSTEIIVYNYVAYNTLGTTVFPGSVNLGDTTSDTTVSTGLLRVQNETAQAIQFGTSGTYLGQNALNGFIVQQAGLNTATVANSNSYFYCPVNIGTSGDKKNLIVNGNVEANRYRAGNGTVGQPSFSFTTASGNDTGLYYQPAGDNVDRLVITVGNSGKFTIRETIAPAFRGIKTHINDLDQQGDLNVTGGATNLTGGNVTIGTSGGTSRNLTVNGDLSVSGSITGTFPVPNNIGNPCLSSTELRFTAVLDADINVPHFVGCYCSQLLGSGGKITITMKNLGVSGLGKTFYVFRSTGDTTNPVQITNDSGQNIYLYNWNNVSKYEQFYLLSNGLSSTIIDVAAGSNYSFSWWKFVYMTINEQNRWIGKRLASCWDN